MAVHNPAIDADVAVQEAKTREITRSRERCEEAKRVFEALMERIRQELLIHQDVDQPVPTVALLDKVRQDCVVAQGKLDKVIKPELFG